MILTFAQYNVLKVAQQCNTCREIAGQTRFDLMMVMGHVTELVRLGMLQTQAEINSEQASLRLTTGGTRQISEYERTNPALIIKSLY